MSSPILRILQLIALGAFALPAHSQEKPPPAGFEAAIFAGGCFWCMEPPYDELPGVVSTTSGYTAGRNRNPTYEQVSAGRTGHTEAVRVIYDPKKVSYEKLLELTVKVVPKSMVTPGVGSLGSPVLLFTMSSKTPSLS